MVGKKQKSLNLKTFKFWLRNQFTNEEKPPKVAASKTKQSYLKNELEHRSGSLNLIVATRGHTNFRKKVNLRWLEEPLTSQVCLG